GQMSKEKQIYSSCGPGVAMMKHCDTHSLVIKKISLFLSLSLRHTHRQTHTHTHTHTQTHTYTPRPSTQVLRVKGIIQLHENCAKVVFDSVKDLVEGSLQHTERSETIHTTRQNIVRDKRGFLMETKSLRKTFAVVYDKRRLLF